MSFSFILYFLTIKIRETGLAQHEKSFQKLSNSHVVFFLWITPYVWNAAADCKNYPSNNSTILMKCYRRYGIPEQDKGGRKGDKRYRCRQRHPRWQDVNGGLWTWANKRRRQWGDHWKNGTRGNLIQKFKVDRHKLHAHKCDTNAIYMWMRGAPPVGAQSSSTTEMPINR